MSSIVSLQSVAYPIGRFNKEPKNACNASFYIEASSLDQVVAELIKKFSLDERLVLGRRGRKPDNASSLGKTAGAPSTSAPSSSSYESNQGVTSIAQKSSSAYKYILSFSLNNDETGGYESSSSSCLSPDGSSIKPNGIKPISSCIPESMIPSTSCIFPKPNTSCITPDDIKPFSSCISQNADNKSTTCIYIIRKGNQNNEGFELLRQQISFQLACMIIEERFKVAAMQQKVVDAMIKKLQTSIAKALIYKVFITKQSAKLLFGCKPKLISKAVKVSSIRKVPVGQRQVYYLMDLKELLIRKSNITSPLITND